MARFCSDLFIRGGRVVDPASALDAQMDVLIVEGRVAAVGARLCPPPGCAELDADGLVVAPGFIDAHVHLREPGFEHKETIASGTAAAAAGGICACIAMPNTRPAPDSPQTLRLIQQRLCQTAAVRVYLLGCITTGRAGSQLAPLAELATAGAVGFSDDGDPVEDATLMAAALVQARSLGLPLAPHEEVRALSRGACMHAGEAARRLHVRGMPPAAEEQMIARDVELVRQTGGPLHVAHVSTAGGVELIRAARAEGLPITCEAMPHHLTLTDEAVVSLGADAKMNPPLRTEADVAALRQGLADGVIDIIATDHAPHTTAEKALPLEQAPFGIIGLETAVGLTLSSLVHPGVLSLAAAIDCWTRRPAAVFRLPGGCLAPGSPGDVTVLDPDREWTVDTAAFHSQARNTPFAGWRLRGKAVATIVGGKIVHR